MAVSRGSTRNLAVTSSGTTITFSYTSATGSNRLLLGMSAQTTDGKVVSSCTYAGTSMTAKTTSGRTKTFYQTAPATGANNFVLTMSSYGSIAWGAATYTGVDQTTPLGTTVTNSGSSSSSVTTGSVTCPTNGAVLGVSGSQYVVSGTITCTAGTSLGTYRNGGSGFASAMAERTSTGSLSWTWPGNTTWAAQGIPINPAATTVTSDLADSYSVRNAVTSDLSDTYLVRNTITSDVADEYLVRNSVTSDLSDSYALRNSVSSDLADSYDIQAAGSVSNDLADSYAVRNTVTSDLGDAYSVRNVVDSDFIDLYAIRNGVTNDLADSYAVSAYITSDLADSYSVLSSDTRSTQKDGGKNKKKKDEKTKEQLELERIFGKEETPEELVTRLISPVFEVPKEVVEVEKNEVRTTLSSAAIENYVAKEKLKLHRAERVRVERVVAAYVQEQRRRATVRRKKREEEAIAILYML